MTISPHSTPSELRAAARAGRLTGPTGGLAPGYEQGNVVILPAALAADFRAYCAANPKPCPLMAEGAPGDPTLPALGRDIDIRRDLPRYRIFENGSQRDVNDIGDRWRDDLVTFVIGCSLTFEASLIAAGIRLRYYDLGSTCAAYVSSIDTVAAGPFAAKLVVTMRGIRKDQIDRVIDITGRFTGSHGEPVHIGDPAAIGIHDLGRSYDGIGLAEVAADETPLFWACGVTALEAARAAAPDICITHAPAHMLITDRPALGFHDAGHGAIIPGNQE